MTNEVWWWTCPLCFDVMEKRDDPGPVIRDRDAHLLCRHPEVREDSPFRTFPSFWKERTA